MKPRVSIVIPAYNEGSAIEDVLGRLVEAVELPNEIVVVVDTPEDTHRALRREVLGQEREHPLSRQ